MLDSKLKYGKIYYAGYFKKYNIPCLIDIEVKDEYTDDWIYTHFRNEHLIQQTVGVGDFMMFETLLIYFGNGMTQYFTHKQKVVNTGLRLIKFRELDLEFKIRESLERSEIKLLHIKFNEMKKHKTYRNAISEVGSLLRARNEEILSEIESN